MPPTQEERERELLPELRRHAVPVTLLVVGGSLGLGVGAATGATDWPVYAAVLLTGAVLVTTVHLRVGLSGLAIWGLVVFALGHVAGGMVPVGDGVLYEQWLLDRIVRYDNLQHAWGFGFVGRAVWEGLRAQLAKAPDPRLAAAVVIVSAGCGLGAVNEVVEYLLTKILSETNVGGYENTARDLVANLVGATTAAILTARALPRRPRTGGVG